MKPDVSGILKTLFISLFLPRLFSAHFFPCFFFQCTPPFFFFIPLQNYCKSPPPPVSHKKEKKKKERKLIKWNVLLAQGSSLFCIDREAQAAPGHLRLSLFFLRDILPPHLSLCTAPPTKAGGSKQYPKSTANATPTSFSNPLIGGAQVKECPGYHRTSRETQFSTITTPMSDLHLQIFSMAVYSGCMSLSHSCTFKRWHKFTRWN